MKSEAWNIGYDAYNDGAALADNPYDKGSQEVEDWEAGWHRAHEYEENEDE